MITNNQINALSEDELNYLIVCFANEWHSLGIGHEFKPHYIKFFRDVAVEPILNKYSVNLKDEYKNIPIEIINKLEQNK